MDVSRFWGIRLFPRRFSHTFLCKWWKLKKLPCSYPPPLPHSLDLTLKKKIKLTFILDMPNSFLGQGAKSTSKVMSPIFFMARLLLDYLYLSILNDSIQYSSFVQRISFLVELEILLCYVHQIFSFSNRDAEAIPFF